MSQDQILANHDACYEKFYEERRLANQAKTPAQRLQHLKAARVYQMNANATYGFLGSTVNK